MTLSSLCAQETSTPIDGYHEFNYGNVKEGTENWVHVIRVAEPELRSEISGEVPVKFSAPGMTEASAWCWQQPTDEASQPWGQDVNLTPEGIKLDAQGNGSFAFPSDQFPNGPVNVRIYAKNTVGKKDIFELQLFNTGGVKWNQGIPDTIPPGAAGLKVVFEDDFDGPLSISKDGKGATYNSHKPGGGDFSGWQFTSPMGDGKPFGQQGTWLRIAARKDQASPKGRSGIIASVDADFKGFWAKAPFYMECRLTAQAAIGSWPAFWTLAPGEGDELDELDIAELYGGKGKGNPNHPGYSIVSHFWRQKNPDGSKKKGVNARPKIMELGGKSYWSTTFHTYAVYVGLEETVYYFDDIEVLRHPTNVVSRDFPHFFLINYAIGGISGWPIDMARYEDGSDMWVDYVRVFAKEPLPDGYQPNFDSKPAITTNAIGLNFSLAGDDSTMLAPKSSTGFPDVAQKNWNNLSGPGGEVTALVNHEGQAISGAQVVWSVPLENSNAGSEKAEHWGFKFSDKSLQLGSIKGAGTLTLSGIPYKKYDVYVYANSGVHAGAGSVALTSLAGGQVDPAGTYHYKTGWFGGKFKIATSADAQQVKEGNTIIFKGNTAGSIQINWENKPGQWSGITGIQIVETP